MNLTETDSEHFCIYTDHTDYRIGILLSRYDPPHQMKIKDHTKFF